MIKMKDRITIALTGASGAQYGLRLIEVLLKKGHAVNVLFSQAALVVLALEMDLGLGKTTALQKTRLLELFGLGEEASALLNVYGEKEWTSPLASGSNTPRHMVVCPCSMGSLAAIATGQSNNLIERAADVILKERRNLILVVRETPFHTIHLENMVKLSQMGALIMPANPGFYHKPTSVDAIIDFMVARILDQLDIEHNLMMKWGEKDPATK